MKKYAFLFLVIMAAIASCDKIEGPYKEENNQIEADSVFPMLTNPIQKIFFEEYTGQKCVNCPQGHKKVAELKERFGDTLVVVAIHSGTYAEPEALPSIYTADYRSLAGDELTSVFGIQGYPSAMLNRTGNVLVGTSGWSTALNGLQRAAPQLAIQLKSVENISNDSSVKVYAKITFLQSVKRNINLSLIITEDSVISPQKNNLSSIGAVPDIADYVHRHMLRGSVNSVWGDAITSIVSETEVGSFVLKGYVFPFKGKGYRKNHCSFIAVAYDVDSKEVLQVEEIHLSH